MRKRIIVSLLCLLCLWSAAPAALASEEAVAAASAETEVPLPAEEPAPAEADLPDAEELSPSEDPVPAEEPVSDEQPDPSEDTVWAEDPVPAEETAEEAADGVFPLADPAEFFGLDPEDPLLGRLMQRLDGISTNTFSDYTTRALNNETLHKGIDISVYQKSVNWTKLKASGVDFVFIRAGYRASGTGVLYEDTYFRTHIRGAKAAGMKVGVYIFSQAITTAEAVEEADYLLSLVKGYDIDLPLVFDLEHYYTSSFTGRFTAAKLSRRAVTDMCLAFCDHIEKAGYESMVYSNPSMLNNEMYAAELGRLWLAHYTWQTGYSGHPYEYWQCGYGQISGVDGEVDLDFWFEPNDRSPFRDVKKGAWFYDAVLSAYESGIVKGLTENTFGPDRTTTRGQLVTMLHRISQEPEWTAEAGFTDLTQDYYRDAVFWASELGVVKGYSNTEFKPDKAVTREELVTILYRFCGERGEVAPTEEDPGETADPADPLDPADPVDPVDPADPGTGGEPAETGDPDAGGTGETPDTSALDAYEDAWSVHSWAREAMLWAVEKGILTGYDDGTLRPRLEASRAVVCTILMRIDALDL